MRHRRKQFQRQLIEPLEARLLLTAAVQTPMGVNIEGLSDWSRSDMFVDAMKTARAYGSPSAPWDGSATVDANGWPTEDFGVCVITVDSPDIPQQEIPDISGVYHLTATGDATITGVASDLSVDEHYDQQTNTLTATITVQPDSANLYLSFTNTNGGLQNIKLIRPGYAADTTQVFTNAFLNSLAPFQTLRFMDYSRTNNNTQVNWSDRTLPDQDQATDNGGAWEYAIQLCNQLNKDMWICVPAFASDDYMTQLATLLKNTLNPGLHVYLEYSNEVWNQIFTQGSWNYDQAQTEEQADPSFLNYDDCNNASQYAWRRVVEMTEHMESIFAGVYGQQAINTRVRPILASQAVWPYLIDDQMKFLNHFYGDPNQTIWAISEAPYITVPDPDNSNSSLTEDQVISDLTAAIPPVAGVVSRWDTIAAYYGVHNMCYEGGISLVGDSGGNFDVAKLPANYDPRITSVIYQYLVALSNYGSDQMMWYDGSGRFSAAGTFGLTENINDISGYKYQAVNQFTQGTPPAVTIGNLLPSPTTGGSISIDGNNYNVNEFGDGGVPGDLVFPNGTFDYLINAPDSAQYTLTLSTSTSLDTAQIEVLVDNQPIATLNLPNTGGNTNFVTLPALQLAPGNTPYALSPGLHTVRIAVLSGGFELHNLTIQTAAAPQISGFSATAASSTQINLSWNAFGGAAGYLIERSPDGVSDWTQIASSIQPGDINMDGHVDLTDLTILAAHWQKISATATTGDLNGDGIVDLTDLTILAGNWQTSAAPPTVFQDSALQPGTTYYYRIRAGTVTGYSQYSAIMSATTMGT